MTAGLLISSASALADPGAAPSPAVSPSPSAAEAAEKALTQTPSPAPKAPADVTWTLAEVKRIALQQNPDLQSALATYRSASARIGQSVSEYLPHVDVAAKYEQTTLPSPSAGSTAFLGISEPYTAGVASLRQTLFDFGQGLSHIQASRDDARSREQESLAVRAEVELGVERAFFGAIAAERLVEVAEKGVTQFKETLRRTDVLVRTGTRPSFDLSQATVELGKARLALIRAQNNRELSRIVLINLMGMQKQVNFALSETEENESVESSKLSLDRLTGKAFEARPEVKQQEFARDSASDLLRGEYESYFPTVALQAWYGSFEANYPDTLRNSWGVGVGATWHLFEGLRTTYRVKELSADVERREAGIEKQKQAVSADVAAALMGLATSESNLKVAEESLDAAKENQRLARKRYEANVGTILELLVAETSLVNAEADEIQSKYQHAIAVAALRRAVGAPLAGE